MMLLRSCVLASATFAALAHAQPCGNVYVPSDGYRGVDGVVYASTMWDPDGAGPRTPLLVVAGSFEFAGTVHTKNVATYDPATGEWGALGDGLGNPFGSLLYAATVLTTGDLVVAGSFDITNGAAANSVARWDTATSSWQQLGNGITGGFVTALTPLANGGLVAGGNFYTINGNPAGHIARWDGAAWSGMNGGVSSPSSVQVFALATLTNGDVVAGGVFSAAGGVPAQNIARWTPAGGGSWSAFGAGADGFVTELTALPANAFIAGGTFTTIAGNSFAGIARCSGAGTWTGYGLDSPTAIQTIDPQPSGDLLVGGYFTNSGPQFTPYIARWVAASSSWQPVGNGANNVVRSISSFGDGGFAACGDMTLINGLPGKGVQLWGGSGWNNWPGFSGPILSIAQLPNGDTIAGGTFDGAGVGIANHIARRAGGEWVPIGDGLDGPARAIIALPDSSFIVGGEFSTADSVSASNIALCSNSGAWSPLGNGLDGTVYALCRASNGDIVAGGGFDGNVARWNGASWSTLGSGPGGTVFALAPLPTGEIIAGGSFTIDNGASANNIAIWNGNEWLPLAEGFDDEVFSLAVLPGGDIIAGGAFTRTGEVEMNRISRWDGNAWNGLDIGTNGAVWALAVLNNGELLVGGEFTSAGGNYTVGLARWNGAAWQFMNFGVRGSVYALAAAPGNTAHLGGTFLGIGAGGFNGGYASPYFGSWVNAAPSITQQPQSTSNCPTGIGTFTFGVTGDDFSFLWFFADEPIDGNLNPSALTSTLVLDHPTVDQSGWYNAVATGGCGTLFSDYAYLDVQSCCPADFNEDGLVDDIDFQLFVPAYNELLCPDFPNTCMGDLNFDGLVDDADFQLFVPAYNALLCP